MSSALVDGLPLVAEYERKLLAIGDFAFEVATAKPVASDDGSRAEALSAGELAKLLDTSIKAYRGGMECARYREDWKNVRLLRDLLARVKREKAELASDRRLAQAEVRH